jgi:hypothetical protein
MSLLGCHCKALEGTNQSVALISTGDGRLDDVALPELDEILRFAQSYSKRMARSDSLDFKTEMKGVLEV